MTVVADSHAIAWYMSGSKRLSPTAARALANAEAEGALVVSVATLIDLWYVTQTTRAVTPDQLRSLQDRLISTPAVTIEPVTVAVTDAATKIPRTVIADPWDRLIVATALALRISLVTRDEAIRESQIVPTVW